MTDLNMKLLRQIMQHLLTNPGEFEWNRYCGIRNIEIIELHSHLQWLRQNEFTRNQEGKTYRTDRPINELAIALGRVPDLPKPIVARSLGFPRRPAPKPVEVVAVIERPAKAARPPKVVAKRNVKPKAKPIARTKRSRPSPPSKRKEVAEQTEQVECLPCSQHLSKIQFWRLALWQLPDHLFAKAGQRYSLETITIAIRYVPNVIVERYSHESFPRYSHRLP